MQEYSKRLGRLSPDQFQAALGRFGLGNFVRTEPVSFGLFGQNVFVTSTQGEFVLRGVPHYPWQFPTERFFANWLHENTGVPVPHPYLLENSTDIFGWPFILMPRLPGVQLQDEKIRSQLSLTERLEVARSLAATLVEAQKVAWDFTGWYDYETDQLKPFELPYRQWMLKNLPQKLAEAQGCNDHTTAADVRWIESVITFVRPALDFPCRPTVVLADYGEHNSVALKTPSGWQVSGVFDLMTAHVGDGQVDLCMPVTVYLRENETLADAFVNKYLRLKPRQPGFVEHQKFYALDLMLNMWRHWQKNEGGVPGQPKDLTFDQYARFAVDYWDKFTNAGR